VKYRLGASAGPHRVLHLESCRLARTPYATLEGLATDTDVIAALGAGLEWTTGCQLCMPKLRRKLAAARISGIYGRQH
jgi:hypothetical protein